MTRLAPLLVALCVAVGACATGPRAAHIAYHAHPPAEVELVVEPTSPPPTRTERVVQRTKRRVKRMVAGAALGAIVGGWLAGKAADAAPISGLDRDAKNAKRTEGALLGAGLGAIAGWIAGD